MLKLIFHQIFNLATPNHEDLVASYFPRCDLQSHISTQSLIATTAWSDQQVTGDLSNVILHLTSHTVQNKLVKQSSTKPQNHDCPLRSVLVLVILVLISVRCQDNISNFLTKVCFSTNIILFLISIIEYISFSLQYRDPRQQHSFSPDPVHRIMLFYLILKK